jgi:hypothetical protein
MGSENTRHDDDSNEESKDEGTEVEDLEISSRDARQSRFIMLQEVDKGHD